MSRIATSVEIWRGSSIYDGTRIVMIATGLDGSSDNEKTGPMIQTWILRMDMTPHEAVRLGADRAVCGKCPYRPFLSRLTGDATCYVQTAQAPLQTWRSWRAGQYPKMDAASLATFAIAHKIPIRIGSYGDPAAIPHEVIAALAAAPHTGYTHGWRQRPDLRSYIMASTDVRDDLEAKALGWRTFSVMRPGDETPSASIACPSDRGIACANCRLCAGADRVAKSIHIEDHGPGSESRKRSKSLPVLQART